MGTKLQLGECSYNYNERDMGGSTKLRLDEKSCKYGKEALDRGIKL